jgi:hypothetical protein
LEEQKESFMNRQDACLTTDMKFMLSPENFPGIPLFMKKSIMSMSGDIK